MSVDIIRDGIVTAIAEAEKHLIVMSESCKQARDEMERAQSTVIELRIKLQKHDRSRAQDQGYEI